MDVELLPVAGREIIEDSRPGRRILCKRRHAGTLAPIFDDPDYWFKRASGADLLKHDRTTTVVRITLCGTGFHLKRYNTKSAWHALRRPFRNSRASNCWTMAHRFLAAGIPTAPPAAMIEEKFGPFSMRSYFIAESVPGVPLLELLRQQPERAPELQRRMTVIFRGLAVNRLSHGDFKATNILVNGNGDLCLLDLDAARRHRLAATQRRAWLRDRERLLRNFDGDPELRANIAGAVPVSLLTSLEN